MRTRILCSVLTLVPLTMFGESPKFDIADVHNSPHSTQPFVRGPFFGSGRYELRYATMLDLIRTAYDIDPEKISGGPSWLEMDRFDVFATIPEHTTAESRKQMLQSMLSERFKLVTHNDSKPMPAYALTVGKHQLKPSDGSGATGCNFSVQNAPQGPPAPGTPIQLPTIVYTCRNTSMASLAGGMLSIPGAAQYLNNTLVVDKTGLEGNWDFSFGFTPQLPPGIATIGEKVPFLTALEKQLGLKLELSTIPMPVIVVDSVNRKPTGNSPEAMKSFPPLPTEFEVASLKPSDPDAAKKGPQQPDIKNGRVYLPNFPLKTLIQVAWELSGDDMLVGAPKWLADDKYDIVAKAPAGVAIGDLTPNRNTVPVNIDALRPMLRTLLTERFQMKAHMEPRAINAYDLVAVKPKLKAADPASRTKWQNGVQPDAPKNKNANTALGRLVTCQNVSMAQLAELLPVIAPGYLHTDVVDTTGLEGGYDFTFSFSPIGAVQQARQAVQGDKAEPDDPSGAITLFDAMTKQLGLKLELQKRPTPVLIIESMERKPIEN
jgi:uncharacterized protein (TIGR03435 family)